MLNRLKGRRPTASLVIASLSGDGMASKTTENAPASCSPRASRMTSSARSAVRPWER